MSVDPGHTHLLVELLGDAARPRPVQVKALCRGVDVGHLYQHLHHQHPVHFRVPVNAPSFLRTDLRTYVPINAWPSPVNYKIPQECGHSTRPLQVSQAWAGGGGTYFRTGLGAGPQRKRFGFTNILKFLGGGGDGTGLDRTLGGIPGFLYLTYPSTL